MLHCVVSDVMPPAVESRISAAVEKTIAVQDADWPQKVLLEVV